LHPAVKKVIIVLWGLVLTFVVWCDITWALSNTKNFPPSWSMLPNDQTNPIYWWVADVDPNYGYPAVTWLVIFILFIVTQESLTLGLHFSEVIVNII
jgi:hypothetical protein